MESMKDPENEGALLRFLYRTAPGRGILKILNTPALSKVCGAFLSSRLSKPMISSFVRKNGIDLTQCQTQTFDSFNACFTRQFRAELRPIDQGDDTLIAPCDGLLTAYPIEKGTVIPAKQSRYTIAGLLGDAAVAEQFEGGLCLVFRLCVHHYHRYCFFDDGQCATPYSIRGKLHTVRPIALETVPVFTENCREVTMMDTAHFGTAAQIEVGALLVGRIQNHPVTEPVKRGQEKGMFLFGGSTIMVLLEPNRAVLSKELLDQGVLQGKEVPVQLGAAIGTAISLLP